MSVSFTSISTSAPSYTAFQFQNSAADGTGSDFLTNLNQSMNPIEIPAQAPPAEFLTSFGNAFGTQSAGAWANPNSDYGAASADGGGEGSSADVTPLSQSKTATTQNTASSEVSQASNAGAATHQNSKNNGRRIAPGRPGTALTDGASTKGTEAANRNKPSPKNGAASAAAQDTSSISNSGNLATNSDSGKPAASQTPETSAAVIPDVNAKLALASVTTKKADLAFAVRVNGTAGPSGIASANSAGSASAATDGTPIAAQTPVTDLLSQSVVATTLEKPKDSPDENPDGGSSWIDQAFASQSIGGAATTDVPEAAASADETAKSAPSAATELPAGIMPASPAVRTVQVQISGAENQRVDVRLVENGGSLTMSVRTADTTLAKALQQGLPEVGGRFEEQQIQAEWWKPGMATELPQQSVKQDFTQSGQQGGSQPGQNPNSQGDQNRRQPAQPDWLDELFDSGKSTQNGTQFTWQL